LVQVSRFAAFLESKVRQSFGQTIRTERQSFGRIEALVIVAYDITFNQLCFNFEQGFKASGSVTNLIHVSANHTTSGIFIARSSHQRFHDLFGDPEGIRVRFHPFARVIQARSSSIILNWVVQWNLDDLADKEWESTTFVV
jgi:hypothetical protein